MTGQVVAEALVDANGAVAPSSIQIVQGLHPKLDEEVVRVFAQWRFRPAMEGGTAVEQRVRIPFNFALRAPTPGQCRTLLAQADSVELARSNQRLGFGERRQLQALVTEMPQARPGATTRTVAEFVVDSSGAVEVGTLRVTESTLPVADAAADLARVLARWRFEPARTSGCAFRSVSRFTFTY